MTMARKARISTQEFARALAKAERPIMQVGVDMCLTTNDLEKLTSEQVEAVFEGVGHLVALGMARP
jgi:hypothetical protein